LLKSEVSVTRVHEKVPEKFWEALVQSRSGSRGFRRLGKLWCRARSGSTRFRRSPRSLGAKPSQVQRVPEKLGFGVQIKDARDHWLWPF
jgi:hypothetical protein